eukprot:gnl/TRDRNA2_/TRDRNA2_28880_c0_seq1.p1 gnl/TRDRNA2_/TRDRNA2_28880_c0~~gnl/TRDRNA2_/TRDRNA2_28880_c0_seq1.p1  ORF type:complete len:559 (-),score=114.40 gnl/TRDRNA2_/TRDRNA2_28880_c0_seq1:75-1751(-)
MSTEVDNGGSDAVLQEAFEPVVATSSPALSRRVEATSPGVNDSMRSSRDPSALEDRSQCAMAITRIALSKRFEYTTLAIISVNAIWIGIDTDLNHSESIAETPVFFIVVENLFSLYFTAEIIIRFVAFKRKWDALKDRWFIFDSFLVLCLVIENWLMPILLFSVLPEQSGGAGVPYQIRVMRLLRLLRLSRLTRLVRQIPELLTIVKGMIAATRTVSSVLLFLSMLTYVFAIIFTGTYQDIGLEDPVVDAAPCPDEDGTTNEQLRAMFGSLGSSMFTLIAGGTLLDDVTPIVMVLREDSGIMVLIFFAYIMLSSFTVLNMLIGILCEVVSTTQDDEKYKSKMRLVSDALASTLEKIDTNSNGMISCIEYEKMCKDEKLLETLENELAIDSNMFADLIRVLFPEENDGKGSKEMSFDEFLKLLVRLRPEECAGPMDVQEFRQVLREQEHTLTQSVRSLYEAMREHIRYYRQRNSAVAVASQAPASRPPPTERSPGGRAGSCSSYEATTDFPEVASATDEELLEELRRRIPGLAIESLGYVQPPLGGHVPKDKASTNYSM